MKYTIQLFILINYIVINGCGTQNNLSVKGRYKLITKTVHPNFEKFDADSFSKMQQSLKLSEQNPLEIDNEKKSSSKQIIYTNNTIVFKEFRSNKLVKEIIKSDQITIDVEYLDYFFRLQKDYYRNGNIRSKGIGSWLGFSIGKGYLYDEQGNLIEIRDADVGYKYSYDKVFDFCKKNNISLEEKTSGPKLTITKVTDLNTNKKNWYISSPNFQNMEYDIFVLDGNTGKIKDARKHPFVNDGL